MAKDLRPIGVDFDDVVANFNDALRVYHNARYGTAYEYGDINTFYLEVLWCCSKEEMMQRVDEFYHSQEHTGMLPVEGAIAALTELSKHYSLVMITSRPDHIREYTLKWIAEHIPHVFSDTHFLGHYVAGDHVHKSKGDVCKEIAARVLIDDALHNAASVSTQGIPALLLDAPWNQGPLPKLVTRVMSWDEILEQLL